LAFISVGAPNTNLNTAIIHSKPDQEIRPWWGTAANIGQQYKKSAEADNGQKIIIQK